MMIVLGRNNLSRSIRLSSATPISLAITTPDPFLGQIRYVESREGKSGTANGSRVLHSSWMMSVSMRVQIRGSLDADSSFSRSESMRLVIQVVKKGRRASSRVCTVAVVQASRNDATFAGSKYSALHIGIMRMLLSRICGINLPSFYHLGRNGIFFTSGHLGADAFSAGRCYRSLAPCEPPEALAAGTGTTWRCYKEA
jgi:hypothetical protein